MVGPASNIVLYSREREREREREGNIKKNKIKKTKTKTERKHFDGVKTEIIQEPNKSNNSVRVYVSEREKEAKKEGRKEGRNVFITRL